MSIASIAESLTALENAKQDIADAITAKGGTVGDGDGYADFAEDIGTISGGVTPTGSITLTDNGTYDVSDYAEAVVAIPGGSGHEIRVYGISNANVQYASLLYNASAS